MALVFMVFDHIYYFFSFTNYIPICYKLIGRLAFPIFLFALSESYYYTSNKKKLMYRLFIGSLLMIVINYHINKYIQRSDGFIITPNIFGTMFMITFYLYLLDKIKEKKTSNISCILYIVFYFISLPLTLFVEGGPVFILLGLVMYYTRTNRNIQILLFSIISLSLIFVNIYESYQWVMIFSIIFFILYNGEKGKGLKHLFYVFYPSHIYILYYFSYLILK
jgi:hypothetical protein